MFLDTGEIGIGMAAGFLSFILVAGVLKAGRRVERHPLDRVLPFSSFVKLSALILFLAFLEEAFFRWGLLGQGSRLVGLIPAFFLSTGLFALSHRPNGRLHYVAWLNLLLVGMELGLIYLWWGLWVAAAAHAGWNLAEWGLGFTVSGEKTRKYLPSPALRVVPGEPFGPEAHWATTLVVALALAVTQWIHLPF
ncbi:MAG: CPBP family intramembrane metalloprotease [Thermaerobacter sp.]|nr:CPBP family intramembrane metalloprotease [Thermaerobacter sp.]